MPRNGSGGYTVPQNSWNPAVNGMGALPNDWMAILNDMVAAIQASIAADGQTPITGSLNFGGFRLRNAGAPQGQGDALRFEQMMKGADVPSATTIAFPVEGSLFDVTGTTTITGISGAFPGRMVLVRFIDALTLTNGTNLELPGGANITTQAGDFAAFVCLDGTKWQCWVYPRAQNDAIMKPASSDHFGATEPTETWPGMTWADSGTGKRKRRNAADDAWVIEGDLFASPVYPDAAQWLGTPIGEEFSIHPSAPLPPTDDPNFRYVILTAGLTGAGQYNEGVLTSETVTGSDPTITATAVVSLAGSPMDGETIDLINTSRVFLRPGPAAGLIVDSQNLAHTHTTRGNTYSVVQSGSSVSVVYDQAGNTGSSGGDEARPRYIPRVYLMRIL